MIFQNIGAYRNALKSKGFCFLGSGHYSTVFRKGESDKVIKVGLLSDEGWLSYIQWAQQTAFRRRFAPKLYSLRKYATFYVAVMEFVPTIGRNAQIEAAASVIWDFDTLKQSLSTSSRNDRKLIIFMRSFNSTFLWDVHGRNYGSRADGSPILFDPAHGIYNKKRKRLEPFLATQRYKVAA